MWVHPKNKMTESEYQIVTGGAGINFWKIEGSKLSKKAGRFGKKFKTAPITSVVNMNTKEGWRVVGGSSLGDILCFDEREISSGVEKAHIGPILCLREIKIDGEKTLNSFLIFFVLEYDLV